MPEKLLVRNHSGPAAIARIRVIRTWLDNNPLLDFGNYIFGIEPALHTPPEYHPVGNPPTQMPAAPENLVASVVEWEVQNPTPPLRPVRTRRPTPYPATAPANSGVASRRTPAAPALPWYGVGGAPEREEEGGAQEDAHVAAADKGKADAEEGAADEEVAALPEEEAPVNAVAALTLAVPAAFSAGGYTEEEHESHARKRRARRKRAKETARKLRRSTRIMDKEEPEFEMPKDKAARVQQAKFDFTGASRRLRNVLSRSYLLSDPYYLPGGEESLCEIAEACGGKQGGPGVHQWCGSDAAWRGMKPGDELGAGARNNRDIHLLVAVHRQRGHHDPEKRSALSCCPSSPSSLSSSSTLVSPSSLYQFDPFQSRVAATWDVPGQGAGSPGYALRNNVKSSQRLVVPLPDEVAVPVPP